MRIKKINKTDKLKQMQYDINPGGHVYTSLYAI